MKYTLPLVFAFASGAALAEETRQLDAHEHGVGTLNIAFDGQQVAMEFSAPGADIVGFEHEAETANDRAAIENAVAVLAKPSALFVLPASAECTVVSASAELESDAEHEEHDDEHDKHADHDDDHDKHADHDDDHNEHEDHAKHDEHEEHADHDDHAEEPTHSEFHAEYQMTCAKPDAIDKITFAYFDSFENAREVEVQIVTTAGAQAFEVERDEPVLDLRNLF